MLRAEEVIAEKGSKLTPESLMALTLEATGDRDQAEAAYAEAVFRQEQ